MFSFFKKKLTEADAAKAFCQHIKQWAYENDTLLKSSIQNLHKDTLTINDFTQHSDALFHATVAQCSMTIENLFPKDQAIRLLTKIFLIIDSIDDIELFDILLGNSVINSSNLSLFHSSINANKFIIVLYK